MPVRVDLRGVLEASNYQASPKGDSSTIEVAREKNQFIVITSMIDFDAMTVREKTLDKNNDAQIHAWKKIVLLVVQEKDKV